VRTIAQLVDQRHALAFLGAWVRFETTTIAQRHVQSYVVKTFSRMAGWAHK